MAGSEKRGRQVFLYDGTLEYIGSDVSEVSEDE
jgi:hypothetical protein